MATPASRFRPEPDAERAQLPLWLPPDLRPLDDTVDAVADAVAADPVCEGPWRGQGRSSRNCQDLWIGVLRDLLISCLVVGSFDEFALLEPGSCSDQGDQVWRVDRPPAG